MSNWGSRRTLLTALLALLVVMLSGCGMASKSEMTNYVMANGLIIEPVEAKEYASEQSKMTTINAPSISGLKDITLEKEINARIQQIAEGLADAPPPAYRGIKVRLPEGAVCREQWINVNVMGNFNDILSVNFNRGMSYDLPGEEYGTYLNQMQTLNLDLHTGKEIPLAALFPKDSDYLSVLNKAVEEELTKNYATEEEWYTMSTLKQVAPFTGLRPEQKYTLSPWGLTLYFDEATPEFDTEFTVENLNISNRQLQPLGVLAQNFYQPPDKESIYTETSLQTPNLISWGQTYDRGVNEFWEEDGVYVSIMGQYSSQLPQAAQDKILELAQIDPAELKAAKASRTEEHAVVSYEVTVWTQCYGDYVSVTQGRYCYDTENQSSQETSFVYRADTGEAVALADLFRPGFDYEPVIKAAIEQALSEEARQGLSLEELYQKSQWSVGELGIELRIGLGGSSQYAAALYSDFGPENMVIFH